VTEETVGEQHRSDGATRNRAQGERRKTPASAAQGSLKSERGSVSRTGQHKKNTLAAADVVRDSALTSEEVLSPLEIEKTARLAPEWRTTEGFVSALGEPTN
jgi:hypothetical protein